MKHLEEAGESFAFANSPVSYERCDIGHINDTFFVNCGVGNPGYILQRVNTDIFKDPDALMANIKGVCDMVREKVIEEGGDPERNARTLIPTKDGSLYFIDSDNGYWRAYLKIEGVTSYNQADTPELFRKAGASFGKFFNQLADYPAETLAETIPNFHNTVSRMADLERAIAEDKCGRASSCRPEIEFALARKTRCSFIVDGIADGRFKLGVTHNDTKFNNILMDDATGEGACIIDLDTVMPGSVLYDFGDAIRTGASSAAEDETDLDKVYVKEEMFEAFLDGFLSELRPSLTDDEITAMPYGAYLMTFEVGIRFLADYLNGDTYFKIHRPNHNLERARNQFKLVADLESKMSELDAICRKYL